MSIVSGIPDGARQIERTASPPGGAVSPDYIPYILSIADALIIVAASVAGGIGYHLAADLSFPPLLPSCALGLLASFIYILRRSGFGHYELAEGAKPGVEITEILVCWFTTCLFLTFFAYLLKIGGDYSRGAFVIFYLTAPVGLLLFRKFSKTRLVAIVERCGIRRNDAVLVGDRDELAALRPRDRIALAGATEIAEVALSEDECVDRTAADRDAFEAVTMFVRRSDCREVLLLLPWSDTLRIEAALEHLKLLPVSVRLLPDARIRNLSSFASSSRQRVVDIEIQRAPLNASERLAKRALDVAVASVSLLLLSPLMLLASIAIKFDSPGPMIFCQRRRGFNGKQFVMLKFRTMNCLEDGQSVAQAMRSDPRVTSVGRLLRATSIDELPQLINVLKGEMSLIGPRPHALSHDNYFERILEDYAFRHHVKPGLTGWAQCNGSRGATPRVEDVAERVKLDLWYINNWSLALDFKILVRTAFEVLRMRNAY